MSDFADFIKTVIEEGDVYEVSRQWQPQYKDQRYDGWTVLHCACRYNSGGLMRPLVTLGCDIEAQTDIDGDRPLHLCAISGNAKAMQALLDAECSLSPLNKKGETPLMLADRMGHHECASLLRSSIEAKDRETSMMIVDREGHHECASLLRSPIEAKGDISLLVADRNENHESASLLTSENILKPSMTKYVEGDLLGKGGYGFVYKCHDAKNGMDFVIKKVLISINNVDDKEVKALKNEIDIYSKWDNHKRIVHYFGTTSNKEEMIIFMEYLPNGSLSDALKKFGPFSIKDVSKYSRQILEGLQFLHGLKIIHRDIKGANILMDSNNDIKLADFGISRSLQTIKSNPENRLTFIGTIYWMAPEVIKGPTYTFTADVWSLGATVLEMLTGNPPFHNFEGQAAIFQIGNGAPVDGYFPKDLDLETRFFLNKMFVHDPSGRADVETLLECPFVRDA